MDKKFYLDGIFSDGMVLQRGRETKIWGFCPEGAQISAALDGISCDVTGSENGRFTVTLHSQNASAGHTITISCGGETISIEDVCFGDVFLLSGQSNMELEVERAIDLSEEDIVSADYPLIRQFTLLPRYMFGTQAHDIAPDRWKKAVYPDVLGLSAAGFFFAKRLHAELDIPVGLVLTAVGGASVEAWMPEEELARFGDYADSIKRFYDNEVFENTLRTEEQAHTAWHEALRTEDEARKAVSMPDDTEAYTVPGMSFDTCLDGYTGSVWFYKEIELEKDNEQEGLLYLGELVDADRTYINGQLVGETTFCYPPRKYKVPAGTLKKGKNLIASRVTFMNGAGGFLLDHPYYIKADSWEMELSGQWRVKTETKAEPAPPVLFPPHLPSGLYNGSLYPLRGFEFTALLWYQGETNAGDSDRYSEKFDVMMEAWRERLSQELPVVCVELCDYINPAEREHDLTGWKDIQSQQRQQPQVTKRCAVALASDLGENYEIHPRRKDELGERLFREVLGLVYGK